MTRRCAKYADARRVGIAVQGTPRVDLDAAVRRLRRWTVSATTMTFVQRVKISTLGAAIAFSGCTGAHDDVDGRPAESWPEGEGSTGGQPLDASSGGEDPGPQTAGALDDEPDVESFAPDVEDAFVERINETRADNGLPPLLVYWRVRDIARAWSLQMQADGQISHNPDLGSSLLDELGGSAGGENVGHGFSVDGLYAAFMASPAHAANIQGNWDYVGLGVVTQGSEIWVTQNFLRHPDPTLHQTLPPFVDDEHSVHEGDILAIWEAGITNGCDWADRRFCPKSYVSRAQTAVFLVKALELPFVQTDFFHDDDGQWYEPYVNALAAAHITHGCSDTGDFCPSNAVTRGQMSKFLAVGFDLPESDIDHFTDDDGAWHEPFNNALADAGITVGCSSDTFCPNQPVTREQMASFIARALKL